MREARMLVTRRLSGARTAVDNCTCVFRDRKDFSFPIRLCILVRSYFLSSYSCLISVTKARKEIISRSYNFLKRAQKDTFPLRDFPETLFISVARLIPGDIFRGGSLAYSRLSRGFVSDIFSLRYYLFNGIYFDWHSRKSRIRYTVFADYFRRVFLSLRKLQ